MLLLLVFVGTLFARSLPRNLYTNCVEHFLLCTLNGLHLLLCCFAEQCNGRCLLSVVMLTDSLLATIHSESEHLFASRDSSLLGSIHGYDEACFSSQFGEEFTHY